MEEMSTTRKEHTMPQAGAGSVPVDELFTIEDLNDGTNENQKLASKAFDKIPKVASAEELLDIAFRRASDGADRERGKKISRNRVARSREIEKTRISIVQSVLNKRLDHIFQSFPDIRLMSPFYRDLSNALVDMEQFKRSLAALRFAQRKIHEFWKEYTSKITKTISLQFINPYRREYYGRIASVIKQIKNNLKVLDDCRRTFRQFPVIDESLPTIAIVGFPNVGKTTLLFKLTGSKPEIAPYAFTTKTINVSAFELDGNTIQVLDTPGTLNRFDKMNSIEKQAHLAMKHISKMLIYVFDPMESYPLADQEHLFRGLQQFGKPIIVYVSKADMCENELINSLKKKFLAESNPAMLRKKIFQAMDNISGHKSG